MDLSLLEMEFTTLNPMNPGGTSSNKTINNAELAGFCCCYVYHSLNTPILQQTALVHYGK